MLILNQNRDRCFNTDSVSSIYISENKIMVNLTNGGTVCIGEYKYVRILKDIFIAVIYKWQNDGSILRMPIDEECAIENFLGA